MVGGGDLLLIGARDGEILPRLAAIEPGQPAKATVASTLVDVGIAAGTAPFALLSQFAGGPRELERYGGGALIQTDDRTALEYSAPRGIYGRSREDNAAAIRALAAPTAARRPRRLRSRDRCRLDLARTDGSEGAGLRLGVRRVRAGGDAQQPERLGAIGSVRRGRRRRTSSTKNVSGCAKLPFGSRPTRPSGSNCRACWPSPATFEGALDSGVRGAAAGAGRTARR